MHFRIQGLPAEEFTPLFSMSDTELANAARYAVSPMRASVVILAGSVLPTPSPAMS